MAVLFTPACLQDGLKLLNTVEHWVTLLQVIHIWCLHGQLDTVYKHLWKMIKYQTPGASQLRECGRLQRCKAGSVTLAQYDDTGLKQHWGKIKTNPAVPRANIEQQPLKPRWRRSLRETCRLGPPLPWPPRPPTTCWPTQTWGSTTTARWSAAPPPTSRWAAAAAREPPWPPPRPRKFPPFRDSNHTQVPKYQKLEWFLRHR